MYIESQNAHRLKITVSKCSAALNEWLFTIYTQTFCYNPARAILQNDGPLASDFNTLYAIQLLPSGRVKRKNILPFDIAEICSGHIIFMFF